MENKAYNSDYTDVPEKVQPIATVETADVDSLHHKKSLGQKVHEYPKNVFFIVGNEFCERFSFYGMKAVLTLYLIGWLGFNETNATALYHGFTVLCYFSPILGSILADGYIGKFHTIFWVSLLYACGNILLAIAATRPTIDKIHPALDFVGLFIIALGTGGIKPCVTAFGGDQFRKGQERWLEQFFSVFYFSINAGSCISTFLSPIFRMQSCNGNDSCYPLAFGVPAGLMILSCVFFVLGSFWYTRVTPKVNIIGECAKMSVKAIKNKFTFKGERDNFLEHYMDDHICEDDKLCKDAGKCYKQQLVKDLWAVYKLIIMYIPMPFFWALYDQQGSKWVIQGTEMSGKIGSINIYPDQVQVLNPILILVFIPIFTFIIYPLVEKCGIRATPLRKMTVGGFLAAVAYVVTALVQLKINSTLPKIPASGTARISFFNYAECDAQITFYTDGNAANISSRHFHLDQNSTSNVTVDIPGHLDVTYTVSSLTDNCSLPTGPSADFQPYTMKNRKAYYLVLTNDGTNMFEEKLQKPDIGEAESFVSFNYFLPGIDQWNNTNMTICRPKDPNNFAASKKEHGCFGETDKERLLNLTINSFNSTGYKALKPGKWFIYLPTDPKHEYAAGFPDRPDGVFDLNYQGAILTTTFSGSDNQVQNETYLLTQENTVSIAWQFPQYFIVTAAEILFSITGLEFSFTQAPPSMKSVQQAIWLFAVAIGDTIVIVVVEAQIFENQAYVYFLFAGLMVFVMLIFMALAQFYFEYNYYTQPHDLTERDDENYDAGRLEDGNKPKRI